jgi:hypothetical protein
MEPARVDRLNQAVAYGAMAARARHASANMNGTNRTGFARVDARCCASVRQFVPRREFATEAIE